MWSSSAEASQAAHPHGSLIAGTDHGIYRWDGSGWHAAHNSPPDRVLSLAAAGRTVYAAGLNGLYRSDDGGGSWMRMVQAPNPLYQVAGYDDWVFVAGNGFLLRSPDRGTHFVAGSLEVKGQVRQVTYATGTGGEVTLFAATSDGLYESADLGATWSLCAHGLPQAPVQTVQVQRDGVFVTEAAVGGVYRSRDLGRHWEAIAADAGEETLARLPAGLWSEWSFATEAAAAGATSAATYAPPAGAAVTGAEAQGATAEGSTGHGSGEAGAVAHGSGVDESHHGG